jgi:ketosteroid isomerase-like protein
MSQENVEIVQRFFEAIVAGDGTTPLEDGLQQFAHEDVVYVEDPSWPGGDTYRGQEAVRDCWSDYDDLLGESASISVEETCDAGDEVVAVVRVSGQTRESRIPYDHTWGYVCRIKDDKLSYFRAYLNAEEALEAAGLSE